MSETDNTRPRREASKVTDFREFHRKGPQDNNTPAGKVAAAVKRIETPEKEETTLQTKARRKLEEAQEPHNQPIMSELEQLKKELEEQKALNQRASQELEEARIRSQLETEKRKHMEIEAHKKQLELENAQAQVSLDEKLKQVASKESDTKQATIQALQQKLAELTGKEPCPAPKSELETKQQEAADQLKKLMEQKQELAKAAAAAVSNCEPTPEIQEMLRQLEATKQTPEEKPEQETLLHQLKAMLQGKGTEEKTNQQKEILQHFLTESNKITTTGGATTLKPDLLKKLTGEKDKFDMGEWLARLNNQNFDESKCENCSENCKQHKKSGMLDKAATNIQHKQIWPQKNLTEDWVDEDIEFKHLQFEHMVAGETRTIQMCTEPAQILGRLALLRRMAYAKLRGYDWPIIRKMYAAIVRSIEAQEHTWESNFDRYEAILYRRSPHRKEEKQTSNTQNQKKWFCRDWNKGNCTKSAPHKAWFGTGTNA